MHLGKLQEISFPQREDNTTFTLTVGDARQVDIECVSEKPGVTNREVFRDWVETLTQVRRELGGGSTQVIHQTVHK